VLVCEVINCLNSNSISRKSCAGIVGTSRGMSSSATCQSFILSNCKLDCSYLLPTKLANHQGPWSARATTQGIGAQCHHNTYPSMFEPNSYTKRLWEASQNFHFMIQVDIGGHPPFPTGSKQFSGNFGNLLFLAVFNFRGHFEALNDVFGKTGSNMEVPSILPQNESPR
jgi:hypothetical protein